MREELLGLGGRLTVLRDSLSDRGKLGLRIEDLALNLVQPLLGPVLLLTPLLESRRFRLQLIDVPLDAVPGLGELGDLALERGGLSLGGLFAARGRLSALGARWARTWSRWFAPQARPTTAAL